jgi:hypothetical protein
MVGTCIYSMSCRAGYFDALSTDFVASSLGFAADAHAFRCFTHCTYGVS